MSFSNNFLYICVKPSDFRFSNGSMRSIRIYLNYPQLDFATHIHVNMYNATIETLISLNISGKIFCHDDACTRTTIIITISGKECLVVWIVVVECRQYPIHVTVQSVAADFGNLFSVERHGAPVGRALINTGCVDVWTAAVSKYVFSAW